MSSQKGQDVAVPALKFGGEREALLLSLAREIAMDLKPIETILNDHSITAKDLEDYFKLPRFRAMIQEQQKEWASATNAPRRIQLKSLAIVEEALPEMFAKLHATVDPLSSKVELLKTLAKLAGVDKQEDSSGGGAKVNITINLGEDRKVDVQAALPNGVTIEGEVLDD